MKPNIKEGLKYAASWFLLMYGLVLAGVSLMLVYLAWAGSVPIWHPPVVMLASMASLTVSSLLT